MALEKTTAVDQITVTEFGVVLYREVKRIMDDGVEHSRKYHRTSLTPGQDLTGQPESVVAIAQAAWTPEVIAAYRANIAAQVAKMGG